MSYKKIAESQRRDYTAQIQERETTRKRLVSEIDIIDKTLEQLRGAVYAVDQLLVSINKVEKEEFDKAKKIAEEAAQAFSKSNVAETTAVEVKEDVVEVKQEEPKPEGETNG